MTERGLAALGALGLLLVALQRWPAATAQRWSELTQGDDPPRSWLDEAQPAPAPPAEPLRIRLPEEGLFGSASLPEVRDLAWQEHLSRHPDPTLRESALAQVLAEDPLLRSAWAASERARAALGPSLVPAEVPARAEGCERRVEWNFAGWQACCSGERCQWIGPGATLEGGHEASLFRLLDSFGGAAAPWDPPSLALLAAAWLLPGHRVLGPIEGRSMPFAEVDPSLPELIVGFETAAGEGAAPQGWTLRLTRTELQLGPGLPD